MFCRFCGKEIMEGGRFCLNCGKEVAEAGMKQEETVQAETVPAESPQMGGQQAYQPANPQIQVNPVQNHPMAWFKFVIYFQLFANAVIMLYNAASGFFGLGYGDDAALIYMLCPELKAVDVIYGIVCLCFAVAAILVRQRLAHYKKNAPTLYLGFVGAVLASSLLYTFAGIAVLSWVSPYAVKASIATLAGSIMGTVLSAAIFLPLNYIYFKKRRELFVN